MGNTLFRVEKMIQPFSHLSLDPIGSIRVRGKSSQSDRIYPLVMVCLASGATHVEIMLGLEAKDVYLALMRTQYRFNAQIIQIFTDGGSQLSANILGEKRNFYQASIRKLWAIWNNTGYSQHRNIAEMKIKMLKKLIKEGIFGIPGPQEESVNRSILETAIQGAVSMVNNVPYLPIGDNHTLLSPADLVNPWRRHENQGELEVQQTPPSNLESLRKAKHILTIKQDLMRQILYEETKCQLNRFKPGRLKLGKNKNNPSIDPGSVILSEVWGTHSSWES